MASSQFDSFDESFDEYRKRAADPTLTHYQKIGTPDAYRVGCDEAIFNDIESKLRQMASRNKIILDIGPGCSILPKMVMDRCQANAHTLIWVDSGEMLKLLPDRPFIQKIPARFPAEATELLQNYAGRIDCILCYSVLHGVIQDANPYDFIDQAVKLLAPGGEFLIGDIPNISMRKRFFSSASGIRFHQQFMKTNDIPNVQFNTLDVGKLDDAILISLLLRYRSAGFETYLMPQAVGLPYSNRREDILIRRP